MHICSRNESGSIFWNKREKTKKETLQPPFSLRPIRVGKIISSDVIPFFYQLLNRIPTV